MNRPRNLIFQIVLIAAMAALMANCSTANQDSPLSLVGSNGKHPSGWIEGHSQYASPDGSFCTGCHGDDLAGGISGVSCSTGEYNGQSCHGNGPAFHPADWVNKAATGSTWHADAYQDGILDCASCHTPPALDAADGKCLVCHFTVGGSKVPPGSGWTHAVNHSQWANSPEEAVCVACHEVSIKFGHLDETCHNCHDITIHDKPYLDHNTVVPASGDFNSQCSSCHAISGTSPRTGAPVCVTCHTVGSPYTRTNCTSCHGRPPGTGRHSKHIGEASCTDCHRGAGTGSGSNHFYDGQVDVVFSVSSFTYSGGKCLGTCHEFHDNRNWN